MRSAFKPIATVINFTLTGILLSACSFQKSNENSEKRSEAKEGTKPLLTDTSSLTRDQAGQPRFDGEKVEVLVSGLQDAAELKRQAKSLGIAASGDVVITLTGDADSLAALRIHSSESPVTFIDSPRSLTLEAPEALEPPDEKVYYLAGQDFGIPAYRKTNPEVDGRGTVIGVIDDGISLFQSGFQKTSLGERKIKAFRAASPELNIVLKDEDLLTFANAPGFRPRFGAAGGKLYSKVWTGKVTEPTVASAVTVPQPPESNLLSFADWNENKIQDSYLVAVGRKTDGNFEICVDLNTNSQPDADECFGDYRKSGEYSFWSKASADGRGRNLAGIFDQSTTTLSLTEGESKGDSHGEGVASVAAGHQIGNKFDGLAPGAGILDYDLSTQSGTDGVQTYTIGTFLRALEWMGQQSADVVNISYSLFFSSVNGQLFMQQAIQKIVQRYNLVICLSGGNNGPGLSSLNRRAIYPPDTLIAGAFVGKSLYEYVHGVTGLPKQGRVVSYSSRGPGPFGEMGPTVLSPLASLTHAAPGEGFRAFSGTSSASPALAGLASNVISKIRMLNLPVSAPLVVHAIRMSGKPLVDVPFVEQGTGLPKLSRAVSIYRDLLKAKRPVSVSVSIPTAPAAETTTTAPQGIFVATSSLIGPDGTPIEQRSYAARLKAVLPATLSESDATNALFPVKVTANAEWITVPERSFLSIGTSEITLTLDFAKARKSFSPEVSELFGSVEIRDENDALLWTIPVTLINDTVLTKTIATRARLGTEESHRTHFFVPSGVQALRIKSSLIEGNEQNISLSIFNPAGVRTVTLARNGAYDAFVAVDKSGWHQLALTKSRGGSNDLEISATIAPVQIKLTEQPGSGILSTKDSSISVVNADPATEVQGALELRVAPTLLKETIASVSPTQFAKFEVDLRGFERTFKLEVRSLGETRWSYFDGSGHSCIWELRNSSDELLDILQGGNGTILDLGQFKTEDSPTDPQSAFSHKVRKLQIRCTVFESTDAGVVANATLRFRGLITVKSDPLLESWTSQGGLITFNAQPGMTKIVLPTLLAEHIANAGYEKLVLLLRGVNQKSAEAVTIGTLDVIKH
jgi:hypothetical protein